MGRPHCLSGRLRKEKNFSAYVTRSIIETMGYKDRVMVGTELQI